MPNEAVEQAAAMRRHFTPRSEQLRGGQQRTSQPQLGDVGERQAPQLPKIQYAQQQQLPIQGTMAVRKPGTPTFDQTGMGKFYNPRNVNGKQFNTPEVTRVMRHAVEGHTNARFFRHAGLGAALRYTLHMPQVPSHMTDYINAQTRGRAQTGINPGALMSGGGYEPMHPEDPWYHMHSQPEA
jgi:hypothetical protein